MFEGGVPAIGRAGILLEELSSVLDGLAELELSGLDRDELLAVVRGFEAQRRRLPVIDHRLVAELDQRGVAGELAARNTRSLLRDVLRISPREAKARCDAAVDLGPRRGLTGEPLPVLLPAVAAAQAQGAISPDHVRVITRVVEQLPLTEHRAVEERLVAEAARFDPSVLARIGRHLLDWIDPDGTLADDTACERRRHATLTARRDGSGELHARLTPAAFAQWQAILDPLAAPRPSDVDGPDPRTPGQRVHDALADAAGLLLAGDELPPSGGTPATVLLTMTLDQLESRTGLVTTAHGGTVSVANALRLAGEANVIPVVLDSAGVLAYGRARRTATTGQRYALAARDQGCCFPGCDAPPGWTQVHHIVPWALGGGSDLDNECLLCGHHHRTFEKRGWQVIMTDGQPYWIPPPWIDPAQTPIRNSIHDPIPA